MPRLADFASGNGSNAQRIIEYFTGHPTVAVDLLLCNKPDAQVIARGKNLGVSTVVFNRVALYETDEITGLLISKRIDFIILAGFLWLIPQNLIAAYRGRIINIHPALLPKYGGKGMYGMKVHEAVVASADTKSGITIHYVDEQYDEGRIIFQAECARLGNDTPATLAEKIHVLEYRYYPEVIEQIVTGGATDHAMA